MQKIKSFIKRLQSKQGLKISLSILIFFAFFISPTLAADTDTERYQDLSKTIFSFLELLSRIRVLLASIAGKLMTNDMVYGSWLHMDQYLWKLRNIFKNFANFSLLAVLLGGIIQFIAKKGGNIQKLITQTLVAGILIQASRFLVAATIDISTVLTAAVGAFPSNFINKNTAHKDKIFQELAQKIHNHYIKINKEKSLNGSYIETVTIETNNNTEDLGKDKDLREKLMPRADTIAGPLIYIGATTLNVQNILDSKAINADSSQTKAVLTTSAIHLLLTGLFSITLVLLIIVNILRIAVLWIFIPLSPIFILLITIGKGDKLSNIGKGDFFKSFGLKAILHAIFKPVLLTAALSFSLIILVSMQSLMNPDQKNLDIHGTTFSTENGSSHIKNEGIFSVEINDEFFKETGKNIFTGLIIYFVCLFMMRYMIKVAATSGDGIIGSTMKKTTSFVEHMAQTVPIFGYSQVAIKQAGGEILKKVGEKTGINLNFQDRGNFGRLKSDAEFKQRMARLTGAVYWEDNDFYTLQKSTNLFAETKSLIDRKGLSPEIRQQRETRVFNTIENKNNIKIGNKILTFTQGTTDKTFANLDIDSLQAVHTALGGDEGTKPQTHEIFKANIKNGVYGSPTE